MAHGGIAVGTTTLGLVAAGSASFAAITGASGLAAVVAALPLIAKLRRNMAEGANPTAVA